jgi:hypothetical protein
MTRLTTLDRGGGLTVLTIPVTLPPRTSRIVIETRTSTQPGGRLIVVTQTSYVPPDPVPTGDTVVANEPSLHNGAPGKSVGAAALAGAVGVMVGAILA